MIEIATVLAIAMIIMAVTLISFRTVMKDSQVNQAYDLALTQLRQARQQAVEKRQQYIVCLGNAACTGAPTPLGAPTAQSIQIYQWPYGTALTSALQLSNMQLPADVKFQIISPGIPTGSTPDGFGNGSAALDFDQTVTPNLNSQIMFMPDGSAHDSNGNLSSGVMYMARAGDLYSLRAITIFGASGRIRGWRLTNRSGTPAWIQQ